jgi:hypothetical protein
LIKNTRGREDVSNCKVFFNISVFKDIKSNSDILCLCSNLAGKDVMLKDVAELVSVI